MNTRTEKLNIIQQIIVLEDEQLLKTISDLLALGYVQANNKSDFWDELTESQKESIELSINQLESGEGISHSQVQAEMKAMLLKK
jgi:CTP:phosphocholine cytidylyltransferase-like protein